VIVRRNISSSGTGTDRFSPTCFVFKSFTLDITEYFTLDISMLYRDTEYSTLGVLMRYKDTCLVGKRLLLEPYSRLMPRALWGSWGGGRKHLLERDRHRPVQPHLFRVSSSLFETCMRWRSNPSGKCSCKRLTRGTVTSTMRRAAHPSECARCGAGAGCSAIKYQSSPRLFRVSS